MRIVLFSLFLLAVASLVPNCAYQSSNKCLSCYYGFELASGKCQKCSTGFVMANQICINQGIYQQQQQLQQQLATTSSSSSTTAVQQSQGTSNVVTASTSLLQSQSSQSSQAVNTVQTVSQNSGNAVSTSSSSGSTVVTFDVSNSGVMYLLQLFGLAGNIPANCASFTPDFKCTKCGTGYALTSNGACTLQSVVTTSSSNTGNVGTSGSTSSGSQTTSSGSTFNSGSSFSSFGNQASTVVNNDPNCQIPNTDGSCYQCYFRNFYSLDTKKCVQVNTLCATWDKLGNCLSCYSGYKLAGSNCSIDTQTSTNSQSSQTTQSTSTTNSGSSTTTSGGALLINSDSNCRTMGSNGICAQCYYSYYFNSLNGFCIPVNPQCQSWNSLGYCLSCYQGYTISGTICVIGSSSSTANSTSSNVSDTSTSNGVITTLVSSDPNCRSQNANGSCSQCYNSFYYDSISAKRCIQVNPLCRTWNNLGYCLSCYQGYNLLSNICIIQSAYQSSVSVGVNDLPLTNQDPNCNTYKDQACIKCATRTYLDSVSKRCIQIDANCKLWTDFGICNNCYDGYYLYNQRQCRLIYPEVSATQLKSPLNSDVNCRASDSNGVCTQCIWRFVLNQSTKKCMKVNDLCKTWSQTTALCIGCYGGYSLTTSGECKVSW